MLACGPSSWPVAEKAIEDYALLAGSIGLFLMLALVMFLTRRINWYELKLGVK